MTHRLHRRSFTEGTAKVGRAADPQHSDAAADYTGTERRSHKPDKSPATLTRWPVGREINGNLTAPGAPEGRLSSLRAPLRTGREGRSGATAEVFGTQWNV